MSSTVTSMRRPIATVSYVCCGGRLEHVDLDSRGSTLSFTHCSSCMVTRWYRGDHPADPGEALNLPKKKAVSRGGGSAASAGPRS
jgi:hypothetical protein